MNSLNSIFEDIRNGDLEKVRRLIDLGLNIESRNCINGDDTPLITAVACENLEITKLLIDSGAQSMAENDAGDNSLEVACDLGYFEIFKILFEPRKFEYDLDKLLCCSNNSRRRSLEIFKLLVEFGANFEYEDEEGSTPLIIASRYSNLKIVEYLVSIGANIEAKNVDGETPLIAAISSTVEHHKNNLKIIDILIGEGAKFSSNTFENLYHKDIQDIIDRHYGGGKATKRAQK